MFFAGRDLTVGNAVSATAVVVWIHGLGDTPDGWGQQMAQLAPALPHVRFELPLAPTQPVACNGGMAMTSWMDLEDIPIDLSTPDTGRHQAESLSRLHALIDGLGVPPERVVVGGFSQGGAMALAVALTSPRALAGCVVFSGWPLKYQDLGARAPESADVRGNTSFLVCHGSADPTVRPECGAEANRLLGAAGLPESRLKYREYPGMGHSSCPAEERDLAAFLAEVLPPI